LDYIYALCEFGSYEEYCLQIFKVANEDKAKFEEYWEVLQKCGYVGATHEGEIEVEDTATDDEIDEMVREEVFNCIEWDWHEKKGED
jgi:predicted metal-binding protein